MIRIAKNAGFCFGVKRATGIVEELIKSKTENDVICTLGKLIHNEQYNEYLKGVDGYYIKARDSYGNEMPFD